MASSTTPPRAIKPQAQAGRGAPGEYPTDTVPVNASAPVPGFMTSRMNAEAFPDVAVSLPDIEPVQVNNGGPTGQTPSELSHGPAGLRDTLAGEFVDHTSPMEAEDVVEREITSGHDW